MSDFVLEVRGTHARYGQLEVLHDVSLTVEPGTTVALIGSNGAGKSTLVKTINGLVPTTGGDVLFRGRSLRGIPAFERVRLGIATVAEGRKLFPEMSVTDNLLAAATFERSRRDRQVQLGRLFEIFPRLRERATQSAGSLSGGEQQMVAVARALMTKPSLLMLDEPSIGLAPRIVYEIFESIGKLRDQGVSMLLVEQNMEVSLKASTYGYVLAGGKIVTGASTDQLRNDPKVYEAYLG